MPAGMQDAAPHYLEIILKLVPICKRAADTPQSVKKFRSMRIGCMNYAIFTATRMTYRSYRISNTTLENTLWRRSCCGRAGLACSRERVTSYSIRGAFLSKLSVKSDQGQRRAIVRAVVGARLRGGTGSRLPAA
ncbi:hypothetical protein [Burkholderia sp. lig30]|uniref:hypothetical protein n=1 Tax=Burkholderia sp. lig30 TaxID=1192124 RepID=UPI00128EE3C6|nr:hypothetical protein [Burkholderia sp. lig30]